MMGPKTLGEIKSDLKSALAKTGKNPILWLEERIAKLQKQHKPDPNEIQLLQSLARVLDEKIQAKPPKKRSKAKTGR
jgi:hypothetical protein